MAGKGATVTNVNLWVMAFIQGTYTSPSRAPAQIYGRALNLIKLHHYLIYKVIFDVVLWARRIFAFAQHIVKFRHNSITANRSPSLQAHQWGPAGSGLIKLIPSCPKIPLLWTSTEMNAVHSWADDDCLIVFSKCDHYWFANSGAAIILVLSQITNTQACSLYKCGDAGLRFFVW